VSINKDRPHVYILPEDEANRQIAIGFLLDPSIKLRNIEVLRPAGGWHKVLGSFLDDHVPGLRNNLHRHLILLIDFDGQVEERTARFVSEFPDDVRNRVFLLGSMSEPEPLRTQCGHSLENIGKTLAAECFRDEKQLWAHPLLAHNETERTRLNASVKSFLFQAEVSPPYTSGQGEFAHP